LFKRRDDFDTLSTNTFYSVERSITGTRSGAAVAATLAVLRHLGFTGYRDIVAECMRLTRLCVERAAELGLHPVIDPVMNIVAFQLPDLKKVVLRLNAHGWRVSILEGALRLVIMPHIDEATMITFMQDLESALK
ncbi:MAG: tyrosine decarboxylase MfnA, partial [Euryarchaeota archaeon]|nr:tyrosine decarboxylase MfnA [Euryarchaeota archaeon]